MSKNDPKAIKNWEKSNIALANYEIYIKGKNEKFTLTLIDLLYISNFKGGNATINEKEIVINTKLKAYSDIFIKIDMQFKNKNLAELENNEVEILIEFVKEIIVLTGTDKSIGGFKTSFLSALMHSYFPNLIPIIDRRLLINLGLVTKKENLNNSKQVIKIEDYYENLISSLRAKSIETKQTIRELDYSLFIMKLPEWAINSKNKNANQ